MSRTPILFVWHFHQPDYRDPWTKSPSLPWVRLHAVRGYSDVLTAFERGESRWTINWSGTLLEQLQSWNTGDGADTAYHLARKPAKELTLEERVQLLSISFWANPRTFIEPIPRYKTLLVKRGDWKTERNHRSIAKTFSTQELLDLQVLFNLVWCGFTLRCTPLVASLLAKGTHYTEEDKRSLLELHASTVAGLLERYRTASAGQRLELTISPYSHPILPLIIDTDIAAEAMPDEPLPKPPYRHPDLAKVQLDKARLLHHEIWKTVPKGIWSSEGAVSPDALEQAVQQGFQWTLTDEGILTRSLHHEVTPSERNRPYRIETTSGAMNIFFRNRDLSDAIGFRYHSWRAETAIADLRNRLEKERTDALNETVTIALDGENAWENYDDGGEGFLTQLAQAFIRETQWRTATPSEVLSDTQAVPLNYLASGSWINSNFRVWVGDAEKNRAWQQLERATQLWKLLNGVKKVNAEHHVLAAQASDWFWWYGDINRSENDADFDRLFRGHLARIYEIAGETIPDDLLVPVRSGINQNATMPQAKLRVVVDGRETAYYEWLGAGEIDVTTHGAIRRTEHPVSRVRFGMDDKKLYFGLNGLFLQNPAPYEIIFYYQKREAELQEYTWSHQAIPDTDIDFAYDKMLELSIQRSVLKVEIGDEIQIRLEVREQSNIVQRVPEFGNVTFRWLGELEHQARYWP